MSDMRDIGAGLVAKLEKDEIYTFLHGFGVGLIYYLILCLCHAESQSYGLMFATIYEKAMVLICSFLTATLIVYTIYHLISLDVGQYAKRMIYDKNSGSQKIDVSERRPLLYLLYDKFYNQYQSLLHLMGLRISTLIVLSPVPWVFSRFIYPLGSFTCTLLSLLSLGFALFIVRNYTKSFIDFLKIDHLISYKMIKVTNSVDDYLMHHNQLVDEYTRISINEGVKS